jgi:dipeptidyl aminopeptidase/acylaminoacyl peptidase
MFRHALVSALALAIVATPALAQQPAAAPLSGAHTFGIDDALNVRAPRIEDVSQDGRWVALTVRVRRDGLGVDNSRFGDPTYVTPSLAEFTLVDATTGQSRPIAPVKVQERGATFSKDGRSLAFFLRKSAAPADKHPAGAKGAAAAGGGTDNTDDWALNVYDIAGARANVITLHTTRAVASNSPLLWAPDGKSVLITLRPDGWAKDARAAFINLTQGPITVQDSREPFLSWDAVRNMGERQIAAIVTIADGSVRELLGETPMGNAHFSPDGSYIVYTTAHPKKTSYDNAAGTEYGVFKLSLAPGAKPDTLLKPADRRINPRWNEAATAFAYDDRGNVMVREIGADSARNLTEKYRRPTRGPSQAAAARPDTARVGAPGAAGSGTDTTRTSFSVVDWRRDGGALLVSSRDGWYLLDPRTDSLALIYPFEADTAARPTRAYVGWSDDGRSLYLSRSARDRWARGLERYDLGTRQATELARDANLYSNWHLSRDGSRFVFERSSDARPADVYTAGADLADAHAITTVNPQLANAGLPRTELVNYLDADGKRLYGVLYYPVNYEPGKKYPLVAEIYENYFDNAWAEQMDLMAGRGYFVLHPSVNFEIGYPGESWEKGVLSAINSLIEKGLVDEKKLGVFGTSYGGYATNLLITQTDRFAAAVNISGKVDIISFLGDSPRLGVRNYNAAEQTQDRIGATLWQAPMKYIQHSAVMFADRIHTPLLMLTGKEDTNVPDTNEREMYYALRRLGREAVWVQYADAGHGAGRAGNEADFRDHWTRMFNWFGDHFEKKAGKNAASGGNQ